jgi:hypothetical protein
MLKMLVQQERMVVHSQVIVLVRQEHKVVRNRKLFYRQHYLQHVCQTQLAVRQLHLVLQLFQDVADMQAHKPLVLLDGKGVMF